MDKGFWNGKRVFVTGHTGFKGSWLCLWLTALGAQVKGYALRPPTEPNLFTVARVGEHVEHEIGDIRDLDRLRRSMGQFRPDVVFHMAAQPLVRASYHDPVGTYATNVMGTVHLLEAARYQENLRCIVNVTSDKCYENREWVWGYRENEPMGGHDPYSNSKGCAELVSDSFRRSFFQDENTVALATARAGNVIGGGDWAADRLIPDILRAFEQRVPVTIRNPLSIRPWQHVLEPLAGYLILANKLWDEGHAFAEAWNFGPNDEDVRPVRWIVERMISRWPDAASWQADTAAQPHEAQHLKLDCSKARARLGWQPRWDLATALDRIIDWHQAWLSGENMQALCLQQIELYGIASNGTST